MSGLGCRHYRNLIGLLGAFGMVLGCVGGPSGNEAYKKEGFQVNRPNPGARVVLRGNHVAAVNQAFDWLNDHQLLVVDRRVDPKMTAQKFSRQNEAERQSQFLAVDRMVGATLWVFAQVDETSSNLTVDSMNVGSQNLNATAVDIQGIDAKTGEVMFGGRAWNSKPVAVSEREVQDLTILALEMAWQGSTGSHPSQQDVAPEVTTEQKAPLMASVPVEHSSDPPAITQPTSASLESSGTRAEDQSMPMESTASFQEQVSVITEPVSEEMSPVSVVTPPVPVESSSDTPMRTLPAPTALEPPGAPAVDQPVGAENSGTSDDSSLGLQIASGALSILYTPVKVVYAAVGGLFGGFVYLVTAGNEQAAQSVWDASLKGTYWLTQDHLQGNEPVRFKGQATR